MTGPSDPKDLWRNQPTEPQPMTLEQIHARGFQSRVRVRNRVEYVACAVVAAAFSAYVLVLPPPLLKAASLLIVAATLFVGYQLHRRASARPTPAAADALAFHRAELVRQREALRTAWAWYLAPFMPGLALFIVGAWLAQPSAALAPKLVLPAATLGYAAFWVWINGRARRRLDADIAEIDALRSA